MTLNDVIIEHKRAHFIQQQQLCAEGGKDTLYPYSKWCRHIPNAFCRAICTASEADLSPLEQSMKQRPLLSSYSRCKVCAGNNFRMGIADNCRQHIA